MHVFARAEGYDREGAGLEDATDLGEALLRVGPEVDGVDGE